MKSLQLMTNNKLLVSLHAPCQGIFYQFNLFIKVRTTPKCHLNSVPFPNDWHITYSANHWANEQTTMEYIDKIILPYVIQKRKDLNLDDSHSALVIFDVFKGQCTDDVFVIVRT